LTALPILASAPIALAFILTSSFSSRLSSSTLIQPCRVQQGRDTQVCSTLFKIVSHGTSLHCPAEWTWLHTLAYV
jgi:hypothetical protein